MPGIEVGGFGQSYAAVEIINHDGIKKPLCLNPKWGKFEELDVIGTSAVDGN